MPTSFIPFLLLSLLIQTGCGDSAQRKQHDMSVRQNRLAQESSPYLLQHAANPVDWWPWGDEAFEEARRLDKPVFLSIGYSTCHWCHVMAHESFEDEEVAQVLNETFICIKLDREERPDIDHIYMQACQMLSGSGGWPLTVFLTPEREPFFAGTYFPPKARHGRPGVLELCSQVSDLWNKDRDRVLGSATQIVQQLSQSQSGSGGSSAELSELPDFGARVLMNRYDSEAQGFGRSPKFPSPHNLLLLLQESWDGMVQEARGPEDRKQVEAVIKTLLAMGRGGIHDHLGGGFHRYSTDRNWHLPHFEKMLYDQAMLLRAFTEALQVQRKIGLGLDEDLHRERELEDRLEGIVSYVLRDMSDPAGAFYSAEDADAAGVEGSFQVWTWQELKELLSEEDLELAAGIWDLHPGGNWTDEASGHQEASNVLHQRKAWPQLAQEMNRPLEELRHREKQIRETLFEAQQKRVRPGLDDKVLCDWNALWISSLAYAGRQLGNPEWQARAEQAADFLLAEMRLQNGRLLHRWRKGEKGIAGMLDDYVFLIDAMLELAACSNAEKWLPIAFELQEFQDSLFWNDTDHVYHMSSVDGDTPVMRPVETYDGAMPCGNSLALLNLTRLARMLGIPGLEERAGKLAAGLNTRTDLAAGGNSMTLVALQVWLEGKELALRAKSQKDLVPYLAALREAYLPGLAVACWTAPTKPFAVPVPEPGTRAAVAAICEHGSCLAPAESPAAMMRQLTRTYRE